MELGPGLEPQCFPLVSLSIKPLDSHAAALLPLVCATVAYNHLFCVCVCVFSAVTCGVSLCLGFVSNSSPTIHLSWALATTDKCCLLVLYNPQGIILNSTWQPWQYSMDMCGWYVHQSIYIICSLSEGDHTNWDPPIGGAFITIQNFSREFTLIDRCPCWTRHGYMKYELFKNWFCQISWRACLELTC